MIGDLFGAAKDKLSDATKSIGKTASDLLSGDSDVGKLVGGFLGGDCPPDEDEEDCEQKFGAEHFDVISQVKGIIPGASQTIEKAITQTANLLPTLKNGGERWKKYSQQLS